MVIDGGSPDVELRVTFPGTNEELECRGRCDFAARPGKYHFYARDPATGRKYDRKLRIDRSSQYQLKFGDDSARWSGLAIGIVGSATLATGLLLSLWGLESATCSYDCPDEAPPAMLVVGTLGLGAMLTPIGWSIFAGNRTRLERLGDANAQATRPAEFRVGLGGVASGGFGLAAQARF